jgi:hypothetical protein
MDRAKSLCAERQVAMAGAKSLWAGAKSLCTGQLMALMNRTASSLSVKDDSTFSIGCAPPPKCRSLRRAGGVQPVQSRWRGCSASFTTGNPKNPERNLAWLS